MKQLLVLLCTVVGLMITPHVAAETFSASQHAPELCHEHVHSHSGSTHSHSHAHTTGFIAYFETSGPDIYEPASPQERPYAEHNLHPTIYIDEPFRPPIA